ncbi:MAG: type I restriction endonuclease subunit M [Planctomycetota bacterium]
MLTPGRYLEAEEVENYGDPFAGKMEGLTREFATQFHESEKLQSAIRENMQKLGFALPEVGV